MNKNDEIREKNIKKYIAIINEKINDMNLNNSFTLRELLDDYWHDISDNLMRSIGKRFNKMVKSKEIKSVKMVEKLNNGNKYEKIYNLTIDGRIVIPSRKKA